MFGDCGPPRRFLLPGSGAVIQFSIPAAGAEIQLLIPGAGVIRQPLPSHTHTDRK